jgi:hypothetical protein
VLGITQKAGKGAMGKHNSGPCLQSRIHRRRRSPLEPALPPFRKFKRVGKFEKTGNEKKRERNEEKAKQSLQSADAGPSRREGPKKATTLRLVQYKYTHKTLERAPRAPGVAAARNRELRLEPLRSGGRFGYFLLFPRDGFRREDEDLRTGRARGRGEAEGEGVGNLENNTPYTGEMDHYGSAFCLGLQYSLFGYRFPVAV